MAEPHLTGDGRTVTVRVPISIRKRGGPEARRRARWHNRYLGAASRQIDNATVKAIAREDGSYATIAEIAFAEKINETYVGRVLRLTLLAPDIVETVLKGRQPPEMTLALLMRRFPVGWKEQRAKFLN